MRIVHQDQRYLLKDSNSLAFYNLPTGTVRGRGSAAPRSRVVARLLRGL